MVAPLGFVAAACKGTRVKERPVPRYTVDITGSSDASYSGTFSVDGVVQHVSGVGMNTWSFQCEELECWFRRGPEAGLLEFEISTRAGKVRAVSTPRAGGECRLIGRGGKVEARTHLKPIRSDPTG